MCVCERAHTHRLSAWHCSTLAWMLTVTQLQAALAISGRGLPRRGTYVGSKQNAAVDVANKTFDALMPVGKVNPMPRPDRTGGGGNPPRLRRGGGRGTARRGPRGSRGCPCPAAAAHAPGPPPAQGCPCVMCALQPNDEQARPRPTCTHSLLGVAEMDPLLSPSGPRRQAPAGASCLLPARPVLALSFLSRQSAAVARRLLPRHLPARLGQASTAFVLSGQTPAGSSPRPRCRRTPG